MLKIILNGWHRGCYPNHNVVAAGNLVNKNVII